MTLPRDYPERVYAGVLGKLIGVYLGRPFEGWSFDGIMAELGEVWYYVHEKRGVPLVVADDDISGTFTFLRALPDHGNTRNLSAAQVGNTWLNYLLEKRTVLWWGGMGNSTEHTAYLRLKAGIPAPLSGAIETNGKVVAEQIGAQIFIDGWGMVCPGDPEMAADFARRAASVSHDGEAIYGAQVVAAMEAQAFVEDDIDRLLDTAVSLIPGDSVIYRMIGDIRSWHSADKDWRHTRKRIAAQYGYDKYGGNCHIVPNHALIINALLHGDGDFQKSLMIVNTCGWDTDCNSGNVGCLLGIRSGLAGIDSGPDWRGPVADQLYLPTADGGRCITDAVQEAYRIVAIARALHGERSPSPKDGARFHFSLPGSVQAFRPDTSADSAGTTTVENAPLPSAPGRRSLAIRYTHLAPGRAARAGTPTFLSSTAMNARGYGLVASPTLYSGQTVRAAVAADPDGSCAVTCGLYLRVYDGKDNLALVAGPITTLRPGDAHEFTWRVPDTHGYPVAEIGVEASADRAAAGTLYLDFLTWDGAPDVRLRSTGTGTACRSAWVQAVDHFDPAGEGFRLIQNSGTGLVVQGTREWTDYQVTAAVSPHMVTSAGIAARVNGLRRCYALLLVCGGTAQLVKVYDDTPIVLAEAQFPWVFDGSYDLSLRVEGDRIGALVDGRSLFDLRDTHEPLLDGAIALACEEGRTDAGPVRVFGPGHTEWRA